MLISPIIDIVAPSYKQSLSLPEVQCKLTISLWSQLLELLPHCLGHYHNLQSTSYGYKSYFSLLFNPQLWVRWESTQEAVSQLCKWTDLGLFKGPL